MTRRLYNTTTGLSSLKTAVLKTLAYSSVFKYPLSISEINNYLIDYELKDESELNFLFRNHNLPIKQHQGYFWIPHNTLDPKGLECLQQRQAGEARARKLLQKAEEFTQKYLRWIPTIKMVTVTGSVAALNADRQADIDLLIVARRGSKWLTRALTLSVLEWKSERINLDKPPSANAGKFCLNMILDEKELVQGENLYVANEIARMKIILNREETYERFLETNSWIYNYLPNWKVTHQESRIKNQEGRILSTLLRPLERLTKWYQARNQEKWQQVKTDHSERILREYREYLKRVLAYARDSSADASE